MNIYHIWQQWIKAGRPGGVSGFAGAWYRSVSCVRIPSSAHLYNFVGTFPRAEIDLRKTRERELATLGEKSTSSGIAEPYARYNLKARNGGENGRHLWPRLVQKLESRQVKRNIYTRVYTVTNNKKTLQLRMRSKMSSKLIFASCEWYSVRVYCPH